MKYEIKKLFANRYIVLLLLCVFILNAVLFSSYCTTANPEGGYTLANQKQKYEQADSLPAEVDALEERLMLGEMDDSSLLTGFVSSELRLDREVLRQITENKEYPAYLKNKIAEMQASQSAGFLGAPEDFAYRAQENVKQQYQSLVGLELPVAFSGGVSVLADWRLTDLLLLVCLMVGGLLLFTEEYANGMLLLLRPTVQGRSGLYGRKLLTMLLYAVVACLLFYGTNVLLASMLLGLGDLSRPIQSVSSFRDCAFPLTVLGYLLRGLLEKVLWICAVSSLIVILSVFAKKSVVAVFYYAIALTVSVLIGSSRNLLLQNMSLSVQSSVAGRYRDYLLLNFFDIPISKTAAFYLLCSVVLLVSCFGGLTVFCKRDSVASKGRTMAGLHIGRHTSLLRHEAYKLFITQSGALLLAVLCLLQLVMVRSARVPLTDSEQYLLQYSQVLSGEQTPEKESYLQEETQRFEEIHKQINNYFANCQDQHTAEMLTEDLRLELKPEDAFEKAKLQYQRLRPGQSYVHPTGYDRLFGRQGISYDLLSTVFFELALLLALSGCMSREKETGVEILQTSAGAKKRICRKKVLLAAFLALLMTVVSYLPQVLLISNAYGLPQCNALAGGLVIFAGVPTSWHIWTVFAFSWFIRLSLAAVSTGTILLISRKTGSTITTILVCVALLVLPPAIGFLLL